MSKSNFEIVPVADLLADGIVAEYDQNDRPVALVVDDERIIADTLVSILRTHGFAAYAAYDGESALEFAAVIPPEVLISDVVMPGMSGIELAIAVRSAVPDCRILLFSGQASTADVLSTARRSGYEFTVIAKPVHPTDLLAHLSPANDSSQTRRLDKWA